MYNILLLDTNDLNSCTAVSFASIRLLIASVFAITVFSIPAVTTTSTNVEVIEIVVIVMVATVVGIEATVYMVVVDMACALFLLYSHHISLTSIS